MFECFLKLGFVVFGDLVSVRLFGLVCRVAPFGVIWGLVGLFWLGGVDNCWWFGLVLVGFVMFVLV